MDNKTDVSMRYNVNMKLCIVTKIQLHITIPVPAAVTLLFIKIYAEM